MVFIVTDGFFKDEEPLDLICSLVSVRANAPSLLRLALTRASLLAVDARAAIGKGGKCTFLLKTIFKE